MKLVFKNASEQFGVFLVCLPPLLISHQDIVGIFVKLLKDVTVARNTTQSCSETADHP